MALAPPIADPPLTDAGDQHSHAWTAYNQAVADSLDRLNAALGVTDGSDAAAKRLERVLTTDPGMGVVRHADAGYDLAVETARAKGIRRP